MVKTSTKVMPKALYTGPEVCKHIVIDKGQKFCLEEFLIYTDKTERKSNVSLENDDLF